MYQTTIGLEVHAEVKTRSKMFCGCPNNPYDSEPNTNVCPVCMGHPGSLPVPNYEAIRSILKLGVALGAELATFSEFNRKHYFYPDIPKAFQLSQNTFPFVKGGELLGVKINRVHLEEDTAKNQHDKSAGSIIDYNRSGVPLMELVTEPVIHDAKTAGDFVRELQLLYRTIDISDANMESGMMRADVNISISADSNLGTKVEIKNLNSFRAIEEAIVYEIERQTGLLEQGGLVVPETRGWDENRAYTFSQRSKEVAAEYRFMAEPDIPCFDLTQIPDFSLSSLAENMPELPEKKREKYEYLGLTNQQIEILVANEYLGNYFNACTSLSPENKSILQLAANYLLTDLAPLLNTENNSDQVLSPEHFLELVTVAANKRVTSRVVKDLLIEFAHNDTDLLAVVKERGLGNDIDEESLKVMIETIIKDNPKVVAEYQSGKTNALQFLLGQAMKQTKGSADPIQLTELFKNSLV